MLRPTAGDESDLISGDAVFRELVSRLNHQLVEVTDEHHGAVLLDKVEDYLASHDRFAASSRRDGDDSLDPFSQLSVELLKDEVLLIVPEVHENLEKLVRSRP